MYSIKQAQVPELCQQSGQVLGYTIYPCLQMNKIPQCAAWRGVTARTAGALSDTNSCRLCTVPNTDFGSDIAVLLELFLSDYFA